jgi:spermidine/putrescine transport system permease protein
MAERLPRWALTAFATLTLLFLFAPAIVILVFSLNDSQIMSWPPSGLSFHWYADAFGDHELVGSLLNSLLVAVVSTSIALVIGVPAGVALDRFPVPGKRLFEGLLMAPFLFPGVISGVALASLFLSLDVQLSLTTVILGHTTMLLGVVVILVLITLRRWDRDLERAAMDLGASEVRAFFLVTLPNMRSAIAGAALLGLTVSLDEVARTFFLVGTQNTLPMVVQSRLHLQITPEINAMGVTVLLVSLIALALLSRIFRNVATER